ncbi:hypothetical protein AY606_08525 [Acinetobacter sp. SFB]|uniref:hypothetical protein n=1 Tax=Acinetobacter sp. SFB TaxID=1805634 RepID=UPI0007D78789|nr:hypothetical protein [Acinetobacter sp. SFB]OAL78460.1 hypothetical protein AY606_08525 [Acinetobacter sp. SFB]
MEIQKKPTLAEKQEFWAEQLPDFEAAYWLPSHFEFVVFDMEQGNYVIKDFDFENDATEIWHRVNTGWAMWKKAINFSRKKAQAVPEGFVLVEKSKLMQIVGSAAIIEPITRGNPLMSKYKTELDFILSTVRAMIEVQEQKG